MEVVVVIMEAFLDKEEVEEVEQVLFYFILKTLLL